MSELKEPREHLFVPYSELQEGDELTDYHTIAKSYYLKSEADKVIAELKKEKEYVIEQTAEVINGQEEELRHHKYKRCMAMAKWCDEAYHRECGLNPEEMTDKEFYKQQIEFWPRWRSRWLAIAEKFKETK